MPKSKSIRMLALLGLVVLASAGCVGDRKASPGTSGNAIPSAASASSSTETESSAAGEVLPVNAVQPSAGVYVFDTAGVEELKAGEITFTFTNSDSVAHEARIIRVLDGNVSAYRTALADGGVDAVGSLGQEAAAAASEDPGGTSTATITLEPGTYVIVDFLGGPAADGPSFAELGMVREFTVVAG